MWRNLVAVGVSAVTANGSRMSLGSALMPSAIWYHLCQQVKITIIQILDFIKNLVHLFVSGIKGQFQEG